MTAHVDDRMLRDYGLGKLDEASIAVIEGHLGDCEACRQRAGAISSNSFRGRHQDARKPAGIAEFPASIDGGTLSIVGARGGKAPPPPETNSIPRGLANHPDYEILRELGRGGMGVVYLARNTILDRDEVLKVMGREIIDRPGVLERFQREIRAVAGLRHPNIVAAHNAFRIEGGLVLSMEYVDGLDLARLVKAKGPMSVAHAAFFAHQAALGLQHAHDRGLIHRDIKPHNLMLTHDGKARLVKILDFGLAKATREQRVESALTFEGQALGTPDYIAPEQILDASSADIRADLYSLGGTLYYLLSGRPPFRATSLYEIYQAHISREADPLNLVRPEIPAELSTIVAKLLSKDPNRRFQEPVEVARALTPFFRAGGIAIRQELPVVETLIPRNPAIAEAPSLARRPTREPEPARIAEPVPVELLHEDAPVKARKIPSIRLAAIALGCVTLPLIFWLAGLYRSRTVEPTIPLEPTIPKVALRPEPIAPPVAPTPEPTPPPPAPEVSVVKPKEPEGVLGYWVHLDRFPIELLPDGKIRGQKGHIGNNEWTRNGNELVIRSPNSEAPGGAWVDTATLNDDLTRYEGTNQNSVRIHGRRPSSTELALEKMPADGPGFVPLFNGKNLSGWKTHPDQPGNWRVEPGGILTGSDASLSHLYSNRDDFKNFHLRAEVRINDPGNAGIYLRNSFGPKRPAQNPRFCDAFEVLVNVGDSNPNRTGSLFGPRAEVAVYVPNSAAPANEWMTLEILTKGNIYVARVDGTVVMSFEDPEHLADAPGHITLLQYRPGTVIEYKKIEVRDLGEGALPGETAGPG